MNVNYIVPVLEESFMYIQLNKNNGIPMTKQIYLSLKSKILNGEIKPNCKLISSRSMSKELNVSRNVALDALNQLLAEGYLYSKSRSGLFVMDGIAIHTEDKSLDINPKPYIGLQFERFLKTIDFRTGVPNLSLFPKNKWGKLYRQVCMDIESDNLDYYEPRGCYELRDQLAQYLKRTRGVICNSEQLLITSGAAQSFSLLIQYFSKINTNVLVEDPISYGITKTLRYFNMNLLTVPVDTHGMITSKIDKSISPKLIFTTPSHQFPTGAVLPMNRRIELINYAKKHHSYIIEDDYDSEFRYEGYPIQSMQSLSPKHIIYVGTFSKMLCPALRIGYMILPSHLVEGIKSIKYIDDLHSPILEQLTLARFIKDGLLDRHVSISKKYYAQKCQFLILTLKQAFEDEVEIFGQTAGIHLMVKFKNCIFSKELIDKIGTAGVNINTVEQHTISKGYFKNHILIGFGNLSDLEIQQGIRILKSIIG